MDSTIEAGRSSPASVWECKRMTICVSFILATAVRSHMKAIAHVRPPQQLRSQSLLHLIAIGNR